MRRHQAEDVAQRWNASVPIGADVNVTRDDGRIERHRTRSDAWVAAGKTPVIMLDGIRGWFDLARCTPIVEQAPQ